MKRESALFVRIGTVRCAIPVGHVVETMRPLPTESIASAPSFVRGLAMIRGEPIVVVDVAALVGVAKDATTRYVVVRTGGRKVALAVDEVIDVRTFDPAQLATRPPLAGDTAGIAALGAVDRELLFVLDAARVIPAELPA